uniref:Uncharacterized protein n=1 Tax=Thermogemmatispora argillosa TaxID=2045280 RepID=A0A455T2F5_9CHLR|nr:hypothetical protein KTA_22190 [Thermogemmatispora argillosa]
MALAASELGWRRSTPVSQGDGWQRREKWQASEKARALLWLKAPAGQTYN